MTLAWIGTLFSGLMWGWICPNRISLKARPLLNLLAATGASLLLGISIYWKLDQKAAGIFLAAAVLAYCVKLGWRMSLRQRFGP